MKPLFITSACFVFLFSACSSENKPVFKEQADKESYSLGYQFGKNLKFEEAEINFDSYIAGLRDGFGGKEPRIPLDEVRSAIANFQQRLASAQQKKQKELAEKNLAEGNAFLAENAKKEGVKTLPSGLQYRVLTEGSGRTPKKSDTVTVNYRGTLISGTEFESSYGRPVPPTFQVDGLIPGWSEALQMMKEGAKWVLFIPPNLAYGEKGSPPVIPPNSVLIFEIELISIQ
jgi:FKBP-type peptidyl-prolyl cis-trans isomerase FklB